MLLNCDVGGDSWESLGLQGDPTSPSERKSVVNILWKDWCWSWNSNTLATWCEVLTHWERPWCWERLTVGGEGDDRGWDGWMVSLSGWTWNWVSSRSRWWTGRPGMLQSMGLQRVGYNWGTELNWIIHCMYFVYPLMCWWTHGLPIPFGYCVSKYLFESLLSHLWRIYPEVEFLTHRIILF